MFSPITSVPCITVYQWDNQCHGPAIYFWYFLIYAESLSVCHALLYTSCLCLFSHLFLLWFICYLVVVCLSVCCSLMSYSLCLLRPLCSCCCSLCLSGSFLVFFRLPLYLFFSLGFLLALLCCQPLCRLSYHCLWILALFIKACIFVFWPASICVLHLGPFFL